jgi:hypothetical protein
MSAHRELIQQVDADIKVALSHAEGEAMRRSLRECQIALVRCATADDVAHVREIFEMVKRGSILSGVRERLNSAARRLDPLVERGEAKAGRR